ncbi:MAG: minichromosome maintenance protein MCM [Candidatus Thermoplasmatota archaeon]|nr:minichromosome maintenance protein MCM [Candidatus Thermoplasmatota archaeon]
MVMHVQDSGARWRSFFEENFTSDISTLAASWPKEMSLDIDFPSIEAWDPAFALMVLENPRSVIRGANRTLSVMCRESGYDADPHVRIVRLPPDSLKKLREISSEQIEKFTSSEVMITKISELKPRIYNGTFTCTTCGHQIEIAQYDELELIEPLECPDTDGGCGRTAPRQTRFNLRHDESTMIDNQWIEVQELPENVKPGSQPTRFSVLAEAELAGKHIPGERVRVNGIPYVRTLKRAGNKTPMFDVYISLHSSERKTVPLEEIDVSPEEIKEIENISKRDDILELFVRSIAPSIIVGDPIMNRIKQTLLMQLFGGVARRYRDGTRTRGDIHILLLGDPGVAKSQLLSYMHLISPRGRFTSGGGTSAAGLTAAAVKDSFQDGRFSLEAGALVLSDQGLCAVDEFDKMTKEDQGSMHEAMEQQRISINKAGISATMPTRCAVLAAANPSAGKFVPVEIDRPSTYIHQQINLPPAMISRFDLVWLMRDDVIESRDLKIGHHIVSVKRTGLPEHLIETGQEVEPVELEKSKIYSRNQDGEEIITADFLKKYVAYAKRNFHPSSDDSVSDILVGYYNEQRQKWERGGTDEAGISLTARAVESTLRLSEAMARIHLRNEVTKDDANFAVAMDKSMRYLGNAAELNTTDHSGVPARQQSAERGIGGIVRNLIRENGGECTTLEVYNRGADQGFDEDTVDRILSTLSTRGTIYQPKPGVWQLV